MYDYGEVYEKIIENTKSVNLSTVESMKIVNKVYNDLNIGLLKPRNITKRSNKLICNSFTRQNKQKEDLTINHHKVNAFIENVKPKLTLSEYEFKQLKERLIDLDEISEESCYKLLEEFLAEIHNDSFKMLKNYSFRILNQSIIAIDNLQLANKYNLFDERILLYGFIDHDKGLQFELLTPEGRKNPILSRKELENEVIQFIHCEKIENNKYSEIRNFELIDEFRDVNNPDIITVKFIENGKFEYLKVKLEMIIGCKFIGVLVDNPEKISNFKKGDEVVVSYCYDYTDNVHVYVKNRDNELASVIKKLSKNFENTSKEDILENLSIYKKSPDFEMIIDTFHNIIFDYFRDLAEFYRELKKR